MKLEAAATASLSLQPLLVPGLLQTEAYSRAIHTADGFVPAENIEGSVAARVSRQRLLSGPDPLHLHAVIDEAVVRRLTGGPDVMREQLERLLELGTYPNVTIQILPFSAGVITYAIIIERADDDGYGAWCPDLPTSRQDRRLTDGTRKILCEKSQQLLQVLV